MGYQHRTGNRPGTMDNPDNQMQVQKLGGSFGGPTYDHGSISDLTGSGTLAENSEIKYQKQGPGLISKIALAMVGVPVTKSPTSNPDDQSQDDGQ